MPTPQAGVLSSGSAHAYFLTYAVAEVDIETNSAP